MPTDYKDPGPTAQKIEDLIKWVRPIVRRWPKLDRETLGKDVMDSLHQMLALATKARMHYYNQSTLRDLDIAKELAKVFMREAVETTYTDKTGNVRYLLTTHSYGVWSKYIDEIGRLIGGWKNASEAKKSDSESKKSSKT